jgi:heme-degrading monooxygenase HmoA
MSSSRCRDKVHDQNGKGSWITTCFRLRDPFDTIAVPIRSRSRYYGRIENERSADKSERKEEIGLFARMNTFEGTPDRLDDALRNVREEVIPQLHQQNGFRGLMFLANYQSGELQLMSLWESAQAMRASEEEAKRLRAEVAEAGDQEIANVERYDVVLFEAPS